MNLHLSDSRGPDVHPVHGIAYQHLIKDLMDHRLIMTAIRLHRWQRMSRQQLIGDGLHTRLHSCLDKRRQRSIRLHDGLRFLHQRCRAHRSR